MLPPYYFYWFRIDNKHMTEPWFDQALMDLAYKSAEATQEFLINFGLVLWVKFIIVRKEILFIKNVLIGNM